MQLLSSVYTLPIEELLVHTYPDFQDLARFFCAREKQDSNHGHILGYTFEFWLSSLLEKNSLRYGFIIPPEDSKSYKGRAHFPSLRRSASTGFYIVVNKNALFEIDVLIQFWEKDILKHIFIIEARFNDITPPNSRRRYNLVMNWPRIEAIIHTLQLRWASATYSYGVFLPKDACTPNSFYQRTFVDNGGIIIPSFLCYQEFKDLLLAEVAEVERLSK